MTPEQMRALAGMAGALTYHDRDRYVAESAAALRAAADQLEAVRRIADSHRSDAETAACIVSVRLDAILAGGNAWMVDTLN